MEFQRNTVRRTIKNSMKLRSEYPHSLQLYSVPPSETIGLQELEDWAVERLKVLRTIERVNLSKNARFSDDWKTALKNDLQKQNLNSWYQLSSSIKDDKMDEIISKTRQKDHVSHFLMRLAYCRTEEYRRWFIAQETDLFRFRFSMESSEDIRAFMKENKMNFLPIPEEEKKKILTKLIHAAQFNANKVDAVEYYKVPFTEALDLVRHRKVYLQAGFAYIPSEDLVSIITAMFRSHLSLAMAFTMRSLPELEDDHRIRRLLNDFDKRYTGQDFNSLQNKSSGAAVTPEMIDGLSKQSFPLCMRHLHETLRSTHHLKHGGRMQYGLFVKGIGLSLENSLKFWREEFSKNMDMDKFEKQYAYNIRHNYGKEGKRINYAPQSCIKIISSSVGPGENHGCPFRHFDAAVLRQKMTMNRVPQPAIQEIVDLVTRHHYQIACQRYFEATHNTEIDSGIQHPNQYFIESQKILNGEVKEKIKGANKVQTIRATLPAKVEKLETNENEVLSESVLAAIDMDDDFN